MELAAEGRCWKALNDGHVIGVSGCWKATLSDISAMNISDIFIEHLHARDQLTEQNTQLDKLTFKLADVID